MANKTKDFVISKNGRYKEVDGDRFVSVFFVDNTRGDVRYSFEGIASGREYTTDFDTFHEDFEPAEREGSKTEESSGPAEKEDRVGSGILAKAKTAVSRTRTSTSEER